jgi:23S rRNA (adenine2503-C2)-methyltransferase
VSYEYVLLAGVNDHPNHARQLATLLRDRTALVNLIPMNSVEGLPFSSSMPPQTQKFVEILRAGNITATVRKRKGRDIDAACGQLRLRYTTATDVASPEQR